VGAEGHSARPSRRLADAADQETSVSGQRVLQTILKNVNVAETEKNLVCQDTGIAVYTCGSASIFPCIRAGFTPR
jgi:tartrate dehydratase alpha subunit/fumarate hydratase class I-like protein